MEIMPGEWVKSYSQGIWRVERVIKDFFELRSSLSEPKELSNHTLVLSKRLLNDKWKRSFSMEICDSSFLRKLTKEEYKLLTDFVRNNNRVLSQFERYYKAIDFVVTSSFSVEPQSKGEFRTLADSLFLDKIGQGLIHDQILKIIEDSKLHEFWHRYPLTQTLQFVCLDHEIKNHEFIFRRYQYFDR